MVNRRAQGAKYERECARLHQDAGLVAYRVPNSGARTDGPTKTEGGDVVVCDEFRIECKYSRSCRNFKRCYDWVHGRDVVELTESGLYLMPLGTWMVLTRAAVDHEVTQQYLIEGDREFWVDAVKSVTEQSGLVKWLGDHDALMCRGPRKPWLVFVPMRGE